MGVDHDLRLFGGSGRGAMRVRLFEAMGWPRSEYFESMKLPQAERVRRYPAMALLGLPISIVERLVLSDSLIRLLRLSGIIVATFEKR